jgi:hypothetical protein
MMFKNALFVLLSGLPFLINCQNVVYDFIFQEYNRNQINNAIKMKDGNVALVAQGVGSSTFENATLLKLNASGQVIKSVELAKASNHVIYINRIVKANLGYALIGSKHKRTDIFLYVTFFDEDLNLIKESEMQVLYPLQELAADFDKDSNIIVGGGTSESPPTPFLLLFGGKINKQGDITMVKHQYQILPNFSYSFDTLPYRGWFSDMQVKKDSNQYVFFSGQHLSIVDTNFNSIRSIAMPVTYNCPPCTSSEIPNSLFYSNYPTALRVNDSIFYITSRGTQKGNRVLYLLKMNMFNNKRINLKTYPIPSFDQSVALFHSIDTTKNGLIYLGGTYNTTGVFYTPSRNIDTTQFILRKLDRDFNVLWTKQYGRKDFYFMYGLLATDDGGCLMYGQRYNFNTDGLVEGYVLKVDGNGLTSNETIIPLSISDISASPNPSSGNIQINIEHVTKILTYRFFDMNGKIIKTFQSDLPHPNFDMSFASAGTYIFMVSDNSNLLGKGKILIQK